jgi:hypothetical protein
MQEENMEIIDRYVAEVGRSLPEKTRPDIEREIRSALEDALEDRSQAASHAPDEEMAAALLKEFGSPAKVAASYQPARYLVGPRLFPTFLTVLKIVLVVIAVLMVVQFGFSTSRPGLDLIDFGRILGESILGFMQAAMQFFGTLVIVFAILEWTAPKSWNPLGEWDPRKLKPVTPEASKIKMGEYIGEIVANVIAILLFTLYLSKIGLYIFDNNAFIFIPVLTDTFKTYVPWLVGLWSLGIVKCLWILNDGRLTLRTRWFSAFLHLVTIVFAVVILQGPEIVQLNATALAGLKTVLSDENTIRLLTQSISLSTRIVLAIIIITSTIDLGKELYQLLFKREK